MSENVVIVAAARTAIGNFSGALAGIPASDLGTGAIIAARTDTGRRGFLRVEALDLSGGTVHLSWRVWDWP